MGEKIALQNRKSIHNRPRKIVTHTLIKNENKNACKNETHTMREAKRIKKFQQ